MSLAATVVAEVGDLRLEVDVRAGSGEQVAVVGPNGAGKTTLLRVLAGLLPPRSGRVVLDGNVLDEPAAGVSVPAERRPVAVVFQEGLLFPHLSARDNVAYGMRTRGMGRGEARRRADAWLERVDALHLARSRPARLSGGERQRVALARALATDPRLLLLDEPFAAVDVGARVGLRRMLRDRLPTDGGVRVLVTHDPLEAMALASRMVVLEGGRVTQQGSIAEVAARPRSAWVATMLGVNLFRGTADASGLAVDPAPVPAGTMPAAGGVSLAAVSDVRGSAFAVVHPRAVQLHRSRPEGSARNVWPGRAEAVDLEGDRVRVRIAGPVPIVAEVTPAAVADLGLGGGDEVWVSVKATEVQVYPE